MTATTTVARWGNSCALRIPADMLELLNLNVHDRVTIEAEKSRIIIKKDKPIGINGIRRFAGILSEESYQDFMEALKDTERIDPDEW
ncbi:MAG: AbrB/MazE/SpoVT family DNA-binding domain-containing protein [Coriobacteriia bacterium]|nr:AbrB/MazE/SpoVT family DNA-binding domain-containing protein [Coriobacteriia bacterium]